MRRRVLLLVLVLAASAASPPFFARREDPRLAAWEAKASELTDQRAAVISALISPRKGID